MKNDSSVFLELLLIIFGIVLVFSLMCEMTDGIFLEKQKKVLIKDAKL